MNLELLRAPLLTLVALWLALGALIWRTLDRLPVRVATHFGLGGQPNGWMTRGSLVLFTLGFAIGLPILLHLTFLLIRRLAGAGFNIPHRDHWLAPERRDATLAHVQYWFSWIICVLVAFFAGVHYVIVDANSRHPVALSLPLLGATVASFLLLKVICLALLLIPFFQVPKPNA
jgi:hypothetical protein